MASRGRLVSASRLTKLFAGLLPALCVAPVIAAPTLPTADFDRIPQGILDQMSDSTKAIGFPGLKWPGSTVTVAFNGGDPSIYPLIEAAASEWTSQGGRLKFSFKRLDGSWRTWSDTDITPAADIRIGFFTDPQRNGYWSAVGMLARRVNAAEPTMNYGKMKTTLLEFAGGANPQKWHDSYAHSVILHEFGHALSLNHEHFHPQCQADLKLQDAVYSLMGPPNRWTYQQALYNMDAPTYFGVLKSQPGASIVSVSPNSDRASVMLYSFKDTFYKSGAASPCRPSGALGYATSLSAQDRAYYLTNYG